jgi:hypothetical protein
MAVTTGDVAARFAQETLRSAGSGRIGIDDPHRRAPIRPVAHVDLQG